MFVHTNVYLLERKVKAKEKNLSNSIGRKPIIHTRVQVCWHILLLLNHNNYPALEEWYQRVTY